MKSLLMIAVLCLGFQSARAAPLYFGLQYQWSQDMGPTDFKDNADPANGFGLLGGYKFSDKWAAEINYDQSKYGKIDMSHKLFTVAAVYRFSEGFMVPYARLGLGVAENSFDAAGVPNMNTFAGHIGAGAEFNFKPVTVFAGARWNYLGKLTDNVKDGNSLGLLVGIIFPTLGDKHETKSVSEAVAAVVETKKAVVDTDGDGVNDNLDKCPNTAIGTKVNAYGCAEKETAVVKINVEFLSGKADVRSEYLSEIESLANFMNEHKDTKVEIAGHSDNSGAAKLNTVLSQKRAEAVASVLTGKFGIEKSRVKAKGYGPSKPLADNKTAEGRATNRRVEAQISK